MTTTVQETTAPQSPVVEPLTDVERRARVLEAAALEIEVRGWCQGEAIASNGSVCLGGAIECALGFHDGPRELVAWKYVWDVWGGGPQSDLWPFNDDLDTTADDVTFLLRWRAQELRAGQEDAA